MFAATLARYFVGLSEELTIVECGAGDGSFPAGLLRTLRDQFPSRFVDTRYVICELSDDARRRAQERLSEFDGHVQVCAVGIRFLLSQVSVFQTNCLMRFRFIAW